MNKKEYRKETERRTKEDEIYQCLCGAVFIGKLRDYDNHLAFYCPVQAEARRRLAGNYPHSNPQRGVLE